MSNKRPKSNSKYWDKKAINEEFKEPIKKSKEIVLSSNKVSTISAPCSSKIMKMKVSF